MERISPNLDEAATGLGASWAKVIRKIHIPILKGPIFVGSLLVIVDSIKELPIAFTLRPSDFDTLAEYGITKGNLAQEQAIMKGRLAMGTTLIGAATAAAYAGNIYGDLPFDKETRDLWRINGIQPNSIKVSVGGRDVYVSYRDLEPFNSILAATANLVNYQHVLGTDYRDETAEKLVWMATATFVDKSMLAGVEDLAILLNADSAGGQVQNILTRGLRTLFPGYGILGQLGDIVDANEKEANTFLENFRKRDLIFKSTIPPKFDILAKDRSGKRYQPPVGSPLWRIFNAFSPVTISAPDGDFVKEGLLEMNFNLPEIMNTYKGVKLTSIEKSELSKYMSCLLYTSPSPRDS